MKKRLEPLWYILPALIVLLLVFAVPLVRTFTMAFQRYSLTSLNNIKFNGMENFRNLFADKNISLIIKNSLFYVVFSVTLQFLLGMILALALRRSFRGRGIYQAIVFLPWAFSAFVVGLLFRWCFNGEYGVVNDILLRLGVISERISWIGTPGLSLLVVILAMVWMGVPFFAIMNLAALQSISNDVYEAASIDGCGIVSGFFAITLPYIKPTIITTILLRTIWVFNSFDLIVMITNGGPASSSQTLCSYMYTQAFTSYDFGMASALGVVLVVALAIYTFVFLVVTNYSKAGDF